MTSEVEERPRLVTGGYGRHRRQLVNYYKHDYSHFSEETFVDEVSHLDFSSVYNSNLNTNGKFDLFYDHIYSVCKKHVPYKRLSKKEVKISSKPWITREILAKMNYRDKLYSKLLKSKQPDPNLRYLYKKWVRNPNLCGISFK